MTLNSAACAFDEALIGAHLILNTLADAAGCARKTYRHAVHADSFEDLYSDWVAAFLDQYVSLVPILVWAPPALPTAMQIDTALAVFNFLCRRSPHEAKMITIAQDIAADSCNLLSQKLVAFPFLVEASDFGK